MGIGPYQSMGTRQEAAGVKVYILDTGILSNHIDLIGSISSDSTGHKDYMETTGGLVDGNGHG